MATNVVFNGVTYSIPAEGDSGWAADLTAYFISIASNAFQKTGGTFTLTAEANFGATYGLKLPYIKSQATNPSATGILRLGNTEGVSWRNAANSADLALTVSAGNLLQFNGTSLTLAGSIVNADIDASAAIAYSKLAALTADRALVSSAGGVVTASSVTATELGYVSGVTSAIQTQLDTKLTAPGGILALSAGGTNKNMTAVNGGLVYSDADSLEVTSAGTSQNWVLSGGAGAPTMSNTTTTGKIIDGSADEIQLTVQGNGTQTSDIFVAETSAGTDIIRATNSNAIIRGTQTNDNAATGYIGEYVSSVVSTLTNFTSSTVFTDATSITLSAGDWDLTYVLYYELGAGTMTRTRMGIGTASGSSTTGLVFGDTAVEALGAVASATGMNASVSGVRKSISGSTTYYAKVAGTFSGGTPQFTCRLSARRVR